MDPDSEEQTLVAKAARGDEQAFRALVQAHEGALARTISAMLGPGDDVEDVGQETFVRFLRALDRFRGDASVRTYLTRIAMNLCLDVLAKRRRKKGWMRIGDVAPRAELTVPDVSGSLDERARRNTVRAAVEALDEKHRAVVVLRFLEERSTKETAQILLLPEGTVMSRLKRALEKLQVTLASEDET